MQTQSTYFGGACVQSLASPPPERREQAQQPKCKGTPQTSTSAWDVSIHFLKYLIFCFSVPILSLKYFNLQMRFQPWETVLLQCILPSPSICYQLQLTLNKGKMPGVSATEHNTEKPGATCQGRSPVPARLLLQAQRRRDPGNTVNDLAEGSPATLPRGRAIKGKETK